MSNEGRPLLELKNLHRGEDIYVLGSASSVKYYEPKFFEDKVTIGINYIYRRLPCRYVLCKELPQDAFNELLAYTVVPTRLVASRYRCGGQAGQQSKNVYEGGHWWVFDHPPNQHTGVDWSVLGSDDSLCVSLSSITSAMHLAAYMGCKNLIMVGIDGGYLDDSIQIFDPPHVDRYHDFLRMSHRMLPFFRDRLSSHYGITVTHLSPFLGFCLEGRAFRSIS